jgi:CBS domain-containing protein
VQIFARDVMATKVQTVASGMSVGELERELIARRVSGFPVVDDEALVGVVSRSDIVRAIVVEHSFEGQVSDYYQAVSRTTEADVAEDLLRVGSRVGARIEGMKVCDVMVRSVLTVEAGQPIDAVARFLVEHGIHRAPVLDGGRLVGIVTSLDVAKLVADGRLVPSEDG